MSNLDILINFQTLQRRHNLSYVICDFTFVVIELKTKS